VLGVSVGALSACDSLLEVELPHILTDDAISDVTSAQIQVNSIQALFECGMSAFSWIAMGHEDIFESVAGVAGGAHVFTSNPGTGACDTTQSSGAWFDQLMGARQMVSTDAAKLGNHGGSAAVPGVYDQLVGGWITQLPGLGERLAAISSIYMAQSLAHFGQFYCEGALDTSNMMTATDFLAIADEWITSRAIGHITAAGNFAMPNGAAVGTTNAMNAAIATRAQIRLAAGDLAGANADAVTVLGSNSTFAFNATRESGAQRRNKVFDSGTSGSPFSGMLGINTFWNGPTRSPNPATGQTWPTTIPFTGYIFLGIQPDGRTLESDNTPVRWAQELRATTTGNPPISLANGSVQDPRVPHIFKSIQGPAPREVPNEFTAVENDIPLVTWRELTLIRARFENEVNNNRAAAIALINGMRAGAAGCTPVSATCVPDISGAYLTALTNGADDASIVGTTDQQEMRMVILEEARRELYGGESGRWYQWKIQNTDLMWFPRFQGFTSSGVYRLQGGVRMNWPADEYERNPNFPAGGLDNRGVGCTAANANQVADVSEKPVNN
jgi:hypothetical protein